MKKKANQKHASSLNEGLIAQPKIESQEPLSVEEKINRATAFLKQRPDLPGSMRQLFGAETLNKIVDLVTSDDIVEVDASCNAEILVGQDFVQYVNFLNEYRNVNAKMFALVEELVEKIKPKFQQIVDATVRNEKKYDLRYVNNQIARFYEILMMGSLPPFRRALLDKMVRIFFVIFWREIEKTFLDEGNKAHYKSVFLPVRRQMRANYRERVDSEEFPPVIYSAEKRKIKKILEHWRYKQNLEGLFPPFAEGVDLDVIEKEQKKQFQKITELTKYRKVLFTEKVVGEDADTAKLSILGDETTPIPGSMQSVCAGSVCVDPLVDCPRPQLKSWRGIDHITLTNSDPGVINYAVSRNTGEICVYGLYDFSFAEHFPRELYLRIKQGIYDMLEEYLEGKSEDIDDLFAKAPIKPAEQTVASVAEGIHQEASAQLPETSDTAVCRETASCVENVLSENVDEDPVSSNNPCEIELPDDIEGDDILNTLTASPDEDEGILSETAIKEIETRKDNYFKFLVNLKRKQIMNALKKLMGDPIHNGTSHAIFKSPITGMARPVPVHQNINPYILRSNLDAWGYSLAEFLSQIKGVRKKVSMVA